MQNHGCIWWKSLTATPPRYRCAGKNWGWKYVSQRNTCWKINAFFFFLNPRPCVLGWNNIPSVSAGASPLFRRSRWLLSVFSPLLFSWAVEQKHKGRRSRGQHRANDIKKNSEAPARRKKEWHICDHVSNSFKQNKSGCEKNTENKIVGHLKWQSWHLLCMKRSLPAVS